MKPALGLASIFLVLLLTACDRPTSGSSAPDLASRNMTDAVGRVVRIPAAPQRILALSELDLDALLALGIRPAGATNGRGSDRPPAYLGTRAAGIESLGNFAQPSLDRIVVLQPDLILAGGQADPERLAQLESIAPTVVSFAPGEFWQDSFRRIADAVGRPEAGERVLDEYRARAAALREKLGAHAGESVSIVRLTPNGPMFMLGDAFAGRVLADLGLVRPPAQRAPGAGHAPPLSREMLADIDGDWLFIGNFTPDPNSVAALHGEPAFAALRAAQRGHVREVDATLWTLIGGPLAAQAVLDDVETAMLGATSEP
jgi:iron complex transport system substrate-binding protein